MSPSQRRSGAGAVKSRATRFGAGACAGSATVVRARRRRWQPTSPAARISRATRFRAQRVPRARSSACTRGAPYVRRLRAWTAVICVASAASAVACAEGPRRVQA